MRKKELRPLKLTRPEQFAAFIQLVWDELYWANTYYDIFKEASRLSKRYKGGVKYSPFFSAYTLRAHCQTALVYLHRIYDQNKDSFGLHRFLLTVRSNRKIFDPEAVRKRREGDPSLERLIQAVGTLNDAQLDRDIEFCSSRNPKVLNLKMWPTESRFTKMNARYSDRSRLKRITLSHSPTSTSLSMLASKY